MNDNMKIKYFDEELEVYDERRVVNKNTYSITLNYVPSPTRPLTVENGKTMLTETTSIPNANQYVLDRENGLLLFNQAMKGKVMTINYSAIGLWCISADKVYTNVDNKGEIIETLEDLMRENRQAIESIKIVGDASTVITQLQANIDSVTGLVGNIAEGSSVNEELTKNITSGKGTNTTLTNTISNANNKINEMNTWVNQHGDIVNLDNRVDTVEVEIPKINERLNANMNETLNVVRKVDGWTNLKSFKCDDGQWVQGDGIHDDTTGIQRAINSVPNNKVYGHGVFYITDTIYIPNRTWIDGDGGVTTTIFKTDKPIDMFITEDKGLFVKLSNFRVKGISGTTLSGLTVPSTNKSSFLTLEKVEFLNFTEHCLSIENMAGAKLYDIRCTCGGKYGLKAIGNNENNIIMNSWFTDSEIDFYMEGGSTTKIYNSYFTTEEKGSEPNTKDTLYLVKLINTSMVKFYECQFETIQDTLLSHVYIDRDNTKHHGTIESGVDNELYKCKWLSLNKKGDLVTIGEISKTQGITAPSRTRITEPEFIQSINNYYDINIKNSIDTTIYRPIVKSNYWSPTNIEIKLNYDNINNFTLIPYKMIDGKETGDWRYTKLSDGTLIIRHKYRINCTNTNVQVITIPTSIPSFLNGSEKSCYFSIEDIGNKTARNEAKNISIGMADNTSRNLQIVQDAQGTLTDLKLNITIIGRWK